MSNFKKRITLAVTPTEYMTSVVKCMYSLGRQIEPPEKLLLYMIENSLDGMYNNQSGSRELAIKAIAGFTIGVYRSAFKKLIASGCIIRNKNSKNNYLCYYSFHPILNRLIKNKVILPIDK